MIERNQVSSRNFLAGLSSDHFEVLYALTAIPDFPVRRFKHSPAGQADQQFWDRIRY